jgi:hypothetical protein
MIDGLFERAGHIPIWILSLGNAVVGVEELEAKMTKHGRRVKSIALRYQHLPAVATEEKKATNQEFIVVGVDEDAPLLRGIELSRVGAQVLAGGIVEQDTNPDCPQRSAAGALAGDSFRQGQPAVSDQPASVGTALQVAVQGHPGLDDPHAGLIEGALDDDGELW